MLDGFWTVEFLGVPGLSGGGVVLLRKGRLLGGDSQYYYIDEYKEYTGIEQTMNASVQVNAFVSDPMSVFGTSERQFGLKLTGRLQGAVIDATGTRIENPNMKLQLRLTKRAEIPG